MAPLTSRLIDVSGRPTELVGAGEGSPLIFLHGGGIVEGFDPLEPLGESFSLHVPFHPGFAGTANDPPVVGRDALVAHYDAVLDTLGFESVVLAGQSLGGWIALSYAHAHPDRVARLVLACPFGLDVPGHPGANVMEMSTSELIHALTNEPSIFEGRIPPAGDDAFREARMRERAAVRGFVPGPSDPELPGMLRTLDVSVLVLWGTDDRTLPIEHAAEWAGLLRNARTQLFEGRGHLLFHEDAGAVDALAAFASAAG